MRRRSPAITVASSLRDRSDRSASQRGCRVRASRTARAKSGVLASRPQEDLELAIGSETQPVALHADSHSCSPEADAKLERVPPGRKPRIDRQRIAGRPEPEKPPRERLPDAAHRGEMEPGRGRAGEVVEIDPAGEPQQLESFGKPPCAGEQRGVHAGESELACAVRGS